MDRKIWPYLLLLGTILALLMVVSWLSPKPVDWRKTFNARDKIPFGLYVLDHEIDSLFGTKVTKYRSPLKKYFEKGINLDWSELQDTFKLAEHDSTYDPEENIAEKVDDTLPEEDMVTADEDVVVEEDYNYPSGDSLTSGEEGPKLFIDQRVMWNVQEINVLMAHVNAGDNTASHAHFAQKFQLSFPLLADITGDTASRYHSLISFVVIKFARRNTFLIDPHSKIVRMYLSASATRNFAEVIKDLKHLQVA